MAILLDQTTKAEYDALSLASARASAVVAALSGTVVVEVFSGTDTLMASGTMAAPWATASGATITVGEVTGVGLLVTTGGAPDASWYCQFRSGSRFVRGTFGVLGSGRDFVWSLASFQTGSRGTLGTVVLTAVAASGLTPGYEPAWLSQVTGADSTFDPPLETTGTILYVATTGNDTTGNGSIGNPYLTIGKANSMLTAGAGGTIYVRGGTYVMASGPVYLKGGNASSWTRVRRYPGESVILDGGFARSAPFESVDQIGYLEIHGFKTRYFKAWGVFVDRNGGSNYLIRNCTALESPAALKFAANGIYATPVSPATATSITIQNIAWQQIFTRVTASVASNVITITAIESGVVNENAPIFVVGVPSAIGRIDTQLTGTPGSTGTYSHTGPAVTYSSRAMYCSYGLTVLDFGTGACSNISVDLVKIQRVNPVATNDTAQDGIAVETGGNITIDRAYIKDVDGDSIDIKNDLGNYTLKRSFGVQIKSGRNVFKAWPGAGYTSTFDNCFAYSAAGRGSSGNSGLIALAGTTGSHIMRRCTIISENSTGTLLNSRWAPGTTKTLQGCIFSMTDPTSDSIIAEMNDSPSWPISTLSNVGTTATLTSLYVMGFVVGQQVNVTGATDAFFNVSAATITGTPTPNSITYAMAGVPSSTTVTSGIVAGVGGSTITDFKYNLFYCPARPSLFIRNNVAYGTPTPSVSQADISSGAFDTTYSGAGMVGNAVGQPTYENAAALNFRLAAGDTAALNKYLISNGISTDADGLIGTVNDYQDIGAFERQ